MDVNVWLSVKILPVRNERVATLIGSLAIDVLGRRVWSLSQGTFYEFEWVAIVAEEPPCPCYHLLPPPHHQYARPFPDGLSQTPCP